MIQLISPFEEAKIRELKVGDEVSISGIVFTGRDAREKKLVDEIQKKLATFK